MRCKICHGSKEREPLLLPCSCRGSIGYVHESCLLRWLLKQRSLRCDVCQTVFRCSRVYAEGATPGIWYRATTTMRLRLLLWVANVHFRRLVATLLRMLFFLVVWVVLVPLLLHRILMGSSSGNDSSEAKSSAGGSALIANQSESAFGRSVLMSPSTTAEMSLPTFMAYSFLISVTDFVEVSVPSWWRALTSPDVPALASSWLHGVGLTFLTLFLILVTMLWVEWCRDHLNVFPDVLADEIAAAGRLEEVDLVEEPDDEAQAREGDDDDADDTNDNENETLRAAAARAEGSGASSSDDESGDRADAPAAISGDSSAPGERARSADERERPVPEPVADRDDRREPESAARSADGDVVPPAAPPAATQRRSSDVGVAATPASHYSPPELSAAVGAPKATFIAERDAERVLTIVAQHVSRNHEGQGNDAAADTTQLHLSDLFGLSGPFVQAIAMVPCFLMITIVAAALALWLPHSVGRFIAARIWNNLRGTVVLLSSIVDHTNMLSEAARGVMVDAGMEALRLVAVIGATLGGVSPHVAHSIAVGAAAFVDFSDLQPASMPVTPSNLPTICSWCLGGACLGIALSRCRSLMPAFLRKMYAFFSSLAQVAVGQVVVTIVIPMVCGAFVAIFFSGYAATLRSLHSGLHPEWLEPPFSVAVNRTLTPLEAAHARLPPLDLGFCALDMSLVPQNASDLVDPRYSYAEPATGFEVFNALYIIWQHHSNASHPAADGGAPPTVDPRLAPYSVFFNVSRCFDMSAETPDSPAKKWALSFAESKFAFWLFAAGSIATHLRLFALSPYMISCLVVGFALHYLVHVNVTEIRTHLNVNIMRPLFVEKVEEAGLEAVVRASWGRMLFVFIRNFLLVALTVVLVFRPALRRVQAIFPEFFPVLLSLHVVTRNPLLLALVISLGNVIRLAMAFAALNDMALGIILFPTTAARRLHRFMFSYVGTELDLTAFFRSGVAPPALSDLSFPLRLALFVLLYWLAMVGTTAAIVVAFGLPTLLVDHLSYYFSDELTAKLLAVDLHPTAKAAITLVSTGNISSAFFGGENFTSSAANASSLLANGTLRGNSENATISSPTYFIPKDSDAVVSGAITLLTATIAADILVVLVGIVNVARGPMRKNVLQWLRAHRSPAFWFRLRAVENALGLTMSCFSVQLTIGDRTFTNRTVRVTATQGTTSIHNLCRLIDIVVASSATMDATTREPILDALNKLEQVSDLTHRQRTVTIVVVPSTIDAIHKLCCEEGLTASGMLPAALGVFGLSLPMRNILLPLMFGFPIAYALVASDRQSFQHRNGEEMLVAVLSWCFGSVLLLLDRWTWQLAVPQGMRNLLREPIAVQLLTFRWERFWCICLKPFLLSKSFRNLVILIWLSPRIAPFLAAPVAQAAFHVGNNFITNPLLDFLSAVELVDLMMLLVLGHFLYRTVNQFRLVLRGPGGGDDAIGGDEDNDEEKEEGQDDGDANVADERREREQEAAAGVDLLSPGEPATENGGGTEAPAYTATTPTAALPASPSSPKTRRARVKAVLPPIHSASKKIRQWWGAAETWMSNVVDSALEEAHLIQIRVHNFEQSQQKH